MDVKGTGSDKYRTSHKNVHSSSSGTCVTLLPAEGRWICSSPSCPQKSGNALDFLMETGRYATQEAAEKYLITHYGPLGTSDRIHLTDLGNSKRLVRLHHQRVRYIPLWGRWLIYSGKHYDLDEPGLIVHLAEDVITELNQEADELEAQSKAMAEEAGKTADEATTKRADALAAMAKATRKWAHDGEASARLNAMVALAKSQPEVRSHYQVLDDDPWILNVENGVLDLRTGELLPHSPERLITKLSPVVFDPNAKCPLWQSVLERCLRGNPDFIPFLQRVLGYCLTGNIDEQVFFVAWGQGANGKGTIFNTFLEMMGDYAVKATQSLLMTSRHERHPTELTGLYRARFVLAVETEQGGHLAEAAVKELTGGDPIRARRMRENFWSFRPTHKLALLTNHRPQIQGSEHAIWRRPKLVPFEEVIPREEWITDLIDQLKAEWPGILNWALEGCLEWQREKDLGIPPDVEAATNEWRSDMDQFQNFLDDRCTLGPNLAVAVDPLYTDFKDWSVKQGIAVPWDKTVLGMELKRRGFKSRRVGQDRVTTWFGLELRKYPPPDPPSQD
jgi:putative DNA primase/helicase